MNKEKIKFVTLGCPKNSVDSEVMMGLLKQKGFKIVDDSQSSDIYVVNTCGFIEDAKQESINAILELIENKKSNEKIIVTGCLSQRYAEDLPHLLSEVDAFVGANDYSGLVEVIDKKIKGDPNKNFIRFPQELPDFQKPRLKSSFSEFIKISEGCSHTCSFCTIPMMRGGLKSRTIEDIHQEVSQLVTKGCKEFNLIAQDLNEYGRDLKNRSSLYQLLDHLRFDNQNIWIRPLYMYPLQFPDKLIRLIKDHPHLVPYVDIPLQHIDDDILKSMQRGSSSKYIYRLIENLKKEIPHISLRTTFITGYPGEDDNAFGKLIQFIREVEFDRLGVFTYSDEEKTKAFELKNKVPQKIRQQRRDFLMQTQQAISFRKNQKYLGETLTVLYEGAPKAFDLEIGRQVDGIGRHQAQAPEIDGQVLIHFHQETQKPEIGSFVKVKIKEALNYDLVGDFVI